MRMNYLELADKLKENTITRLKEEVIPLNEFTVSKDITGLDHNIMMGNASENHPNRIKIFIGKKPAITIASTGGENEPAEVKILPNKQRAEGLIGGPKELNKYIKFFKENYDLVLRITDGMMNSVYKGISKQLENEIKEELKRRSKK